MGKKKNVDKPAEDVDESTKGVDKPWDTLMKLVMEKGAQAFASLALPGVEVGKALDKELRIAKMEGDFFCDACLDSLAIILHFEFQRSRDENMDRQVWKYNVAMDIITDKPVYSVLVYLAKEKRKKENLEEEDHKKGNCKKRSYKKKEHVDDDDEEEDTLVGSPYVREIPGTGMGHHFAFQVIKLWKIPQAVLKQSGFEELLPLLPLTKDGQNPETVDDMITELLARDRSDLLELGHFCAGLVFDDERSKQWLKERFHKVQEIVEQSWVYQAAVEKGVEKGIEKGIRKGRQQALQQAAISIVKARFPELEQFASKIIETITDLNRLQVLIVELTTVSSQEDAREILRSLLSGA